MIFEQLRNRQKISRIDLESIYSTYEGHTIFSIFWDQISVFEQILSQLQSEDFPKEEDDEGNDCENA